MGIVNSSKNSRVQIPAANVHQFSDYTPERLDAIREESLQEYERRVVVRGASPLENDDLSFWHPGIRDSNEPAPVLVNPASSDFPKFLYHCTSTDSAAVISQDGFLSNLVNSPVYNAVYFYGFPEEDISQKQTTATRPELPSTGYAAAQYCIRVDADNLPEDIHLYHTKGSHYFLAKGLPELLESGYTVISGRFNLKPKHIAEIYKL